MFRAEYHEPVLMETYTSEPILNGEITEILTLQVDTYLMIVNDCSPKLYVWQHVLSLVSVKLVAKKVGIELILTKITRPSVAKL